MQHCNDVTEFKQVENEAFKLALRKRKPTRCHESCMGIEIHLQLGRHIIRFALGD